MRVKEKIIESERYSAILFNIATGVNYNEILSKELKTEPNALIQHLKRLKKEHFIIGKKGGKFNKNIYSINWDKVKEELFEYIKSIDSDIKLKESFYENKKFENFLKELFIKFKEENATIKIFFESFVGHVLQDFLSFPMKDDKKIDELRAIITKIGDTRTFHINNLINYAKEIDLNKL